jgi:hypothetical protein
VLLVPALLATQLEFTWMAISVAVPWLVAVVASYFPSRSVALVVYPLILLCPLLVGLRVAGGWDLFTSVPRHLPPTWLAAPLGALLTGVWFGGYLAAALAMGCHNNEAGGAARVDRFIHFIRFKVEPERITGYVIGVKTLVGAPPMKPILIDEFYVGNAPLPPKEPMAQRAAPTRVEEPTASA